MELLALLVSRSFGLGESGKGLHFYFPGPRTHRSRVISFAELAWHNARVSFFNFIELCHADILYPQIMSTVNDRLRETFQREERIRIVFDVFTETLYPTYLESTYNLLDNVVTGWKHDERFRLLAIEIYSRHTYIVLDVNNREYDFETAHNKERNALPVYLTRQSKKSRDWVISRFPKEDDPIAKRVADLHRRNGNKRTPFLENHNSTIVHLSPRK